MNATAHLAVEEAEEQGEELRRVQDAAIAQQDQSLYQLRSDGGVLHLLLHRVGKKRKRPMTTNDERCDRGYA